MMLKNRFIYLCRNFTNNQELINTLWKEIKNAYSHPKRYYHTLTHLEKIYAEVPQLTKIIEFSIFYHDIIYNVLKIDNEKQSALIAEKRLSQLNVPKELILEVSKLINETKTHQSISKCHHLFLDADIAIFGVDIKEYYIYTQNIRKEYYIYNDEQYNIGRKKVLKYFLEKKRIYKSEYFYKLYEKRARNNIKIEYNSLI